MHDAHSSEPHKPAESQCTPHLAVWRRAPELAAVLAEGVLLSATHYSCIGRRGRLPLRQLLKQLLKSGGCKFYYLRKPTPRNTSMDMA